MSHVVVVALYGTDRSSVTEAMCVTSNYEFKKVSSSELARLIASGVECTNACINDGKIVIDSGAASKYLLINPKTGETSGTASGVILSRIEVGGKLTGYVMFTVDGKLREVKIPEAVDFCKKGLIANGKLRDTNDGPIVQSIRGLFPIRAIEVAKAPAGKTNVNLLLFSQLLENGKVIQQYFCAVISSTSAAKVHELKAKLDASNKVVVSELRRCGGPGSAKSVEAKNFGVNALYGVYTMDTLNELVKSGCDIKIGTSEITLSTVQYESTGLIEEVMETDLSFDKVTVTGKNDKLHDASLEFVKKIGKMFKGKINS